MSLGSLRFVREQMSITSLGFFFICSFILSFLKFYGLNNILHALSILQKKNFVYFYCTLLKINLKADVS